MYEIIWAESAKKDLINIVFYYKENVNITIANKIYVTIKNKIKSLCFSPNRTRIGRKKGTREFVIQRYPYFVVIKVDDKNKNIFILNIVHTSKCYP